MRVTVVGRSRKASTPTRVRANSARCEAVGSASDEGAPEATPGSPFRFRPNHDTHAIYPALRGSRVPQAGMPPSLS